MNILLDIIHNIICDLLTAAGIVGVTVISTASVILAIAVPAIIFAKLKNRKYTESFKSGLK